MEGKKRYIALVIFLFLALMIFTFANPGEEEKEFTDGGNKEQTEQVDKNEQTKEENTENQENNQTENNQVKDNSYETALAAVEKAEASYKQDDVDAAKELVNKVTDPTKKGELEDRLDEVEAGIEVMSLIQELEYQVAKSENKDDLNDAKDYRDEHEVAEKVAALTNEEVKEALQERLDKVSKILDDDKAPVVNIENNQAFKENTTIEVEDEAGNDFTIYLSKDGEEKEEIENGTTTTSEGIYELTVVDKAFNEETIRFVVDGTNPKFNGLTSGKHYEEIKIAVEDLSNTTITISKDHTEKTSVDNNTTITEEGTYEITATDEAGNTTTVWVAVDKTAPTIERTDEVEYSTNNQTVTVKDKFLTAVKVEGPEFAGTYTRDDFTVGEHNENFAIEFNFTKEGTYTINATDKFGYVTKETFTIDKTAPVINGLEEGKYFYNKPVKPELVEENIASYTLNGEAYDGKEITKDGYYTLVAIDKAGQKREVKFAIDQTAPIITGVEDNKFYNTTVKPGVEDANLAYVTINKLPYIPGVPVFLYGKYELVAVDKAGNSTTVNFTIDTIAPKVLLLDRIEYISGKYLPIKPVILEQYIDSIVMKKDGEVIPYEKGQQLTDDAKYEMTVTDKAGNTTTVEFTMDSVSPTAMVKPAQLGVVSELDLNNLEVIDSLDDLNLALLNKDILLTEDAEFILLKKEKSYSILDKEIPIYKPITMPADKKITEEGEYVLIAYDKAYNLTAIKFTVDKSAPVINGLEAGKEFYTTDVTITVTEANPYKLLGQDVTVTVTKKGILFPTIKTYKANETFTLNEDGEYTIKAKDIAGNETEEITFTIDKIAPVINADIKEEVLQSDTELNVVATVEEANLTTDSNELKPTVYVKNGDKFELVSNAAETIDVSTNGVTYKLVYTYTDKAGHTASKEIITTVVNITYEVRFSQEVYEGTYNGQKHSVPTEAKYYMIKDGVESEVAEEITYTSSEDMINAGEYTITAKVGNYSATAIYKINKAVIEVGFGEMPSKAELGQTLEQYKANITTNHFEGNVDILDYKMYRTSFGLSDTSLQETTVVDKVTEGKGIFTTLRTYTIYVTIKEEYADNYEIKGSLNIDLTDKGINFKVVGVSTTLNS